MCSNLCLCVWSKNQESHCCEVYIHGTIHERMSGVLVCVIKTCEPLVSLGCLVVSTIKSSTSRLGHVTTSTIYDDEEYHLGLGGGCTCVELGWAKACLGLTCILDYPIWPGHKPKEEGPILSLNFTRGPRPNLILWLKYVVGTPKMLG